MTIMAVLFDLDETLFDRTTSLRHFLADQIGRHSTLQNVDNKAYIDRFLRLDQRGRVSKSTVYRELLLAMSIDDHSAASALFHDYEDNFWRFARAFPGIDELFEQLGELGVRTGIVTNGQTHIQLRSLAALNLDQVVDAFLISESEGARKPDPEIFERAAHRLNANTNECIFVGDTPVADIVGSQRCGMRGVWFPNGAVWPSDVSATPDAEIASLAEIPSLVRKWR